MSDSLPDEIGAILTRAIGVDIAAIGTTALTNAVKHRQAASATPDRASYAARLRTSEDELQALIDAVVVPETWFFRDREAFAALAGLLPRGEGRPLRILSLPCATGEEPYSIAIALFAAGFTPDRFEIHAVDVSVTLLAQAARAVYGENAFRGTDSVLRHSSFERVQGGYRPVEAVRRQVRFALGNLLDPGLLAANPPFDAIFCRNVLIYFDRSTQMRVLDRVRDLMTPEGLLFVAPSEQSVAAAAGFASLRWPGACAFRRSAKLPATTPAEAGESRPAPRRKARPPVRKAAAAAPKIAALVPPPPSPPPAPRNRLVEARRLADAGRLSEAAECCEAAIAAEGPSAALFCLLGLIGEARGERQACIGFYRKALYLDPDHHEALLHLSLELRRLGDPGAPRLEARLERLARAGGRSP
jgi:chemotaxis protein methyltransferase WspC